MNREAENYRDHRIVEVESPDGRLVGGVTSGPTYADETIEREDVEARRLQEREQRDKAFTAQRKELLARRGSLTAQRLYAVEQAEKAADALVEAVIAVHTAAADEFQVLTQFGEITPELCAYQVRNRMAKNLCAMFRRLPGATPEGYGVLGGAKFIRTDKYWLEAEPGHNQEKEDKDDE